jgi:hypothetical protein
MIHDAITLNKAVPALVYLINQVPGLKALKGFPQKTFEALARSQSSTDLEAVEKNYFEVISYLAQSHFREKTFQSAIKFLEESDEMILVVNDLFQDLSKEIDVNESKIGDKTFKALMQEALDRAHPDPAKLPDPAHTIQPSNDYNDREKYSDEALYALLKQMDFASYKNLPNSLNTRLKEIENKYPLWQDYLLRDFLLKNDTLTTPQAKKLYEKLYKAFLVRADVLPVINFAKNLINKRNYLLQCTCYITRYSPWIDGKPWELHAYSKPEDILKADFSERIFAGSDFYFLYDISNEYPWVINELLDYPAFFDELVGQSNRLEILDQILRKNTREVQWHLDSLLIEVVSKTDDTEMLQLLLNYGANPNKTKNDHLLLRAVRNGYIEQVKLLLKHGANINETDGDGMTALSYAADRAESKMVQLLLDQGAKVDLPSKDGQTPLHNAAIRNNHEVNKEVVEMLLKAGADVNHQETRGGFTPLMFAVSSPSNECVAMLLAAGARLDIVSRESRTAMDYACPGNMRLLQSKMAATTAQFTPSRSTGSSASAGPTNEPDKKPWFGKKPK